MDYKSMLEDLLKREYEASWLEFIVLNQFNQQIFVHTLLFPWDIRKDYKKVSKKSEQEKRVILCPKSVHIEITLPFDVVSTGFSRADEIDVITDVPLDHVPYGIERNSLSGFIISWRIPLTLIPGFF